MSSKRHHAEWLSLVEVTGPFLSIPVLEKVFPQGLDAHDSEQFRTLKLAYDEWETNQTSNRPSVAVHSAWINFILKQTLGLPDEVLAEGQAIPTLKATISEHGETLRPDLVVRNPADYEKDASKSRLLVQVYPMDQNLDKAIAGKHWKASPATRMMELLHATDVRLGLVTNGEQWMLVDAPRGDTTGFASWYAWLWIEQSDKEFSYFRSFRSLLSVSRFFSAPEGETLEDILADSATHQQEVTDRLGLQVRNAVEILIQSLDRADQDDKVLAGVPETVLYEAALTVMMRLVFLFSAEERKLLLLGDPLYDQHYAVSTLVAQLQEAADLHDESVLERRPDAWVRLLSTFRAVYGGVQHERMKLPAYSGNLFNPDRFPFLEGRKANTTWLDTKATPLPVNNRTVLHLLRSLQYLESDGEARRLSFQALDIEQIGHVYEGLLDHTAKRATEAILGLFGGKGKDPEVPLAELERHKAQGEDELIEFLVNESGRSDSAVRRALEQKLETADANRLRAACGNDERLFERVRPFASLIRTDSCDRPVVIRKGSVYVTSGTDRRSSGTHYTPKSLTEPIVQHTLEPLVYIGPPEGKSKEEWKLRPASELLDLKICDMTCGSGAFLVQACRYLSELLLEAWDKAEAEHPGQPGITPEGIASTGAAGEQLIPKEADERLVYARRIVAQRCLYGVDKNPLAVEMAKLSLWLLTLAKDKPFTFVDHAIRSGDSLVGISSLDQLLHFSLSADAEKRPLLEQQRKQIENRLSATRMLRRQIEEMPSNTPQDVELKASMLKNADEQTRRLTYAADLLLAAGWEPMSDSERETALNSTLILAADRFKELRPDQLDAEAKNRLREAGVESRFHWPLEFPEVFVDRGGFDAFIGNPPFIGGRRIRGSLGGTFLDWLTKSLFPGSSANSDICAFFFRRAFGLLQSDGVFGLLATNTIAQGDTRDVGLAPIVREGGTILRAIKSQRWPGTASVVVSQVWVRKGGWNDVVLLDEKPVSSITSSLTVPGEIIGKPHSLIANDGISFQGSIVLGMGFVLSDDEAKRLLSLAPKYKDVVRPYLTGEDVNSDPRHHASRWVINFFDWPLNSATSPKNYDGPVAADYPACLSIIEEKVKPERTRKKPTGEYALRKPLPEKWWIYADKRPALYSKISRMQRVLCKTRHSPNCAFAIAGTDCVFQESLIIFAFADFGHFSVLSSSIHEAWAWEYGSTLGDATLRYSSRDCFLTFPFPKDLYCLKDIGEQYHSHRREIMLSQELGITDTYNRFHDTQDKSPEIKTLRKLHVEMDRAVIAAYGWKVLDLGHDFQQTRIGVRYTINEAVQRDVLQRLLKLNHERYAEEAIEGLHKKKGKAKASKREGGVKKGGALQKEFFGEDDDEPEPAEAKNKKSSIGRNSSRTTNNHHGGRSTSIDQFDNTEIMAAFRQAARGRGWIGRDELVKEVSVVLGYQRLRANTDETLRNHLRAAIRRRIIEADGASLVRPGTTTMADYTLDEFRTIFCSVMRKGASYDREDVMQAVVHYLGFSRLTDNIRQSLKSALNSAIRQGVLGYEGNFVWRGT
jgi:hypothetical protein